MIQKPRSKVDKGIYKGIRPSLQRENHEQPQVDNEQDNDQQLQGSTNGKDEQ